MKRFLAILLVITLLFSLASVLTGCSDDGSSSSSSSSKKNKTKTRVYQGMTIGVGKSYELEDEGENYAKYSDGQYDITVHFFDNTNDFDTETFYSNYLNSAYSSEDMGEITDLVHSDEDDDNYYIAWTSVEEETPIALAFYTTDAHCWIVEIRNCEDAEEFNVEDMIDLIIGWKYSDPEDEEDEGENEDDDDEDYEGETTAPLATEATDTPSSASLKDLVINLDDSFTTVQVGPTCAEYENDKFQILVYFMYDQYYESDYQLIDVTTGGEGPHGNENGVNYTYKVEAYGSFTYMFVRSYYVKDGYGWIVEITNPTGYYNGVSEAIDLATCHYFK